MKSHLCALLFAAVAMLEVSGATYYVDYTAGSDAAAGVSTDSPWQHCPGDGRATGNARLTLGLGDVVIFKGGVSYVMNGAAGGGYINVNQHQVTFKSGHVISPQWGTTAAIINGTNAVNTGGISGVLNVAKTNVTVDGLFFLGLEYQDSYAGCIYWSGRDLIANLIIRNCAFSNIVESAIYVAGQWESGFNANFTVTNCTFGNIGTHGVFLRWGITNAQVLNCSFDRIGVRTDSPAPGGDPIGVFGHDAPTFNAGLIVRSNNFSNVPIKSYVIMSGRHAGALFECNYFSGTNGYSGFDLNGAGTNLTIRNNVFDMRVANFRGAITGDTDQGNRTIDGLKIYNNTIRVYSSGSVGAISLMKGNQDQKVAFYNVDIRNNIIIQSNPNCACVYVDSNKDQTGSIVDPATFTCDYNVFSWVTDNMAFRWRTNYNFASWKNVTGQGAKSRVGIPTFISGAGFRLADSDTTARGNGTNLSSLFTADKDGNIRPFVDGWDIGAFQSGKMPIKPVAPYLREASSPP